MSRHEPYNLYVTGTGFGVGWTAGSCHIPAVRFMQTCLDQRPNSFSEDMEATRVNSEPARGAYVVCDPDQVEATWCSRKPADVSAFVIFQGRLLFCRYQYE